MLDNNNSLSFCSAFYERSTWNTERNEEIHAEQYIIDNNISLNWIIILREIDLKIEEKKHEIYTDLRDIIDKAVLKVFMTILDEELTETKNLIIALLEDLKEHGKHDKSLYVTAERSVETHFEHFENRMYNKIKDLLN